jgi:hypothetical protein
MIDLITVVFREELPLLKIQAESINQYFTPEDINSITVIINDNDNVADLIDTTWWKQHQSIVKIKPYSQYNYTSRVNGWENQQLLKLLAAEEANSTWSMVLDAKTWFVQPINAKQLFDDCGRACTGVIGIFPQFAESQQFVEIFYNIELKKIIGPSGVPFLFHTPTVVNMINSIDNFPDFFQTALRYPHLTTEFYFYSGYVLSQYQTYDQLYSKTQRYNCLNLAEWQIDQFDLSIELLQTTKQFHTASIHRRTYAKLTQEQRLTWVLFLKDSNLITDEKETQNLLNTYIK